MQADILGTGEARETGEGAPGSPPVSPGGETHVPGCAPPHSPRDSDTAVVRLSRSLLFKPRRMTVGPNLEWEQPPPPPPAAAAEVSPAPVRAAYQTTRFVEQSTSRETGKRFTALHFVAVVVRNPEHVCDHRVMRVDCRVLLS